MRISVKIPLLAVVSVSLTAVAVGSLSVGSATRALQGHALDAAAHGVEAYAHAIRIYLESATAVLEVEADDLSSDGAVQSPAGVATHARSLAENSEAFGHIAFLNGDGNVVVVAPQAPSGDSQLFGAWLEELRTTRKSVVSDLIISPFSRAPTVAVAAPVISSSGALTGVWVGFLRLETFSAFGRSGDLDRSSFSGLVADSNGLIIGHHTNADYVGYQTDFSNVPSVRAALAGTSGSGTWFDEIDEEQKLGGYVPLPGPGWAVVYSIPAEVALAPVDALKRTVLLIAFAAALLIGAVTIVLARRLTVPFQKLSDSTSRIAQGVLSERVEVMKGTEAKELAIRFNAMVEALEIQDGSLRAAARDLQAANTELDAFAYSVSHDLRSPLRAIDGFSKVLLDDYDNVLDQEGRESLARVRAATQRMATLIDDMLGLSRISRSDLNREDVDLAPLARLITEDLREEHPARDVAVDIDGPLLAHADPRLAEILMRNLIGNAWKFTSKTPEAHIWVGSSAAGIFHVQDNGAGFDMAYKDKLFGSFQRLHASRDFEGTGIGLATVRRIVQRHGGWVRAEGVVGRGATFVFAFEPAPELIGHDPEERREKVEAKLS